MNRRISIFYERTPAYAEDWLNSLYHELQSLEEMPTRCSRAPESVEVDREIHQLLFGKRRSIYRVLFVVIKDEVRILHVRHGAREHLRAEEIDLPSDA